jgi:hypothetical protein
MVLWGPVRIEPGVLGGQYDLVADLADFGVVNDDAFGDKASIILDLDVIRELRLCGQLPVNPGNASCEGNSNLIAGSRPELLNSRIARPGSFLIRDSGSRITV